MPRSRARPGSGGGPRAPPRPVVNANGCGNVLVDAHAFPPGVMGHYSKGGLRGMVGDRQTIYCHHFTTRGEFAVGAAGDRRFASVTHHQDRPSASPHWWFSCKVGLQRHRHVFRLMRSGTSSESTALGGTCTHRRVRGAAEDRISATLRTSFLSCCLSNGSTTLLRYAPGGGGVVCGNLLEGDHDCTCTIDTCLFRRNGARGGSESRDGGRGGLLVLRGGVWTESCVLQTCRALYRRGHSNQAGPRNLSKHAARVAVGETDILLTPPPHPY